MKTPAHFRRIVAKHSRNRLLTTPSLIAVATALALASTVSPVRAAVITSGDVVGTPNVNPFLIIGNTAPGSMTINSASAVTSNGGARIGNAPGGNGHVAVYDTASQWTLAGQNGSGLDVGSSGGAGGLFISNGGSVLVDAQPSGDPTIYGKWVQVGDNGGTGSVHINSGGTLVIRDTLQTGYREDFNVGSASSQGSATVTAGGRIEVQATGADGSAFGNIGVGAGATGSLLMTDSSFAVTSNHSNAVSQIGAAGGTGSANLTNSSLEVTRAAGVGANRIAVLNVGGGGVGSVGNLSLTNSDLLIRSQAGGAQLGVGLQATGSMTVDSNSTVDLASAGGSQSASLVIGIAPTGVGNVDVNGGVVTLSNTGAGPIAFTDPPFINSSGAVFSQGFNYPNQAARDAAFTTGTYTFVATNSSTSATASASLDYLADHYPSAIPQFSAATYTSLQGMDASQTFQFNFNSFYGDSFDLGLALSPSDVATRLVIFKPNPPAPTTIVFNSSALASTATNYTISANTLLPGTTYFALLQFSNILHYPGSPVGNFQQFANTTIVAFQTAAVAEAPAPGALALMGLGMTGLWIARRRHRAS